MQGEGGIREWLNHLFELVEFLLTPRILVCVLLATLLAIWILHDHAGAVSAHYVAGALGVSGLGLGIWWEWRSHSAGRRGFRAPRIPPEVMLAPKGVLGLIGT